MNWKEVYNRKKANIDDIIKLVNSNFVIVVGMTPMEPKMFLQNLHNVSASRVDVFTCLNTEDYKFFMDKKFSGFLTNNSWFFGASNRRAWKEKYNTTFYVPNNLHQAGMNLIATHEVDLFVGVASPMDSKGFLTLSASVVYEKDIIERAKKIVLEVNPNAPRTHGDTQVHISDVDYVVEVDYQLPKIKLLEPTELEEKIAFNIVDLIEDGSTIQLGIGGIPNAVAKFLMDKKDLGVHTEMFTESMVDLFEAGVINNKQKTLWPGKFICTFAFGTKRMYEFIDDNPAVFFLRGKYVNDPYVISQNKKMISINTALMIDLTGNVCSEAIGVNHYSGTGGQLDTHRGAVKSEGGKGIIAIRSTAKNGGISTIVPVLPEGSPVTIPRQELDYVVTEWGVAQLRGKSVKSRAETLISIAHPKFRDYLKKEAKRLGLI